MSSESTITQSKQWSEQISPLQQTILKISNVLGIVLFFVGVQFIVRGKNTFGGILSGVGMFIAVQMKWGIAAFFQWLENNQPSILEKMGHRKLFWIAIIVAYVADCIGLGLLLGFLTG